MTDVRRLSELVYDVGFCVIVSVDQDRPLIAHAPVLLEAGALRFHLSAVNPVSAALRRSGRGLAVATADGAYVSPDWYGAPDQVPTWNYRSVEIEGPVRTLTRPQTVVLLDDLSARFEARLAPKPPWSRAKMDAAVFEAMLAGIIGFELAVERIDGVAKLSQNKTDAQVRQVAGQLGERPDAGSRAVAQAMKAMLARRAEA